MQQDILIIGLLFPVMPLMMVNFGNRYSVQANMITHLHDEVICDAVSPKDGERFPPQFSRLRNGLRLSGIIQSCAALSFVLPLRTIITAYFKEPIVTSILFLGSIFLMIGSMLLCIRQIHIANGALDVNLFELETDQR